MIRRMPLARLQLAWWVRPGVILGLVLVLAGMMFAAGLVLALVFPGS